MSKASDPSVHPDWIGPEGCPFCGADLDDGGPAFIAHLESSPVCESGFDSWRERAAADIGGGWSG